MKKKIILPMSLLFVSLLFAGFSNGQSLSFVANELNHGEVALPIEVVKVMKEVSIEVSVDDSLLSDEHGGDGDVIIYANEGEGDHFVVEEFIQYDRNATEATRVKIKEIHIPELERIRSGVGKPIIIRSAARTKEHELKRGRSGKSQHIYQKGAGAVDISLIDYSEANLDSLEKSVFNNSRYTRVSRYKSYLHLDFAQNRNGGRGYYRNSKLGWLYIGQIN